MEEKTFFEYEGVKVTNARFIADVQTCAMHNVTSVKSAKKEPNRTGGALAFLFGLALAAVVLSAQGVAAPLVRCDQLLQDFDLADREMARIAASSVGDDSAPRESNRQLRILTQSLNKSMTLQLILANKCSGLPERADGSDEYSRSALDCRTEQLRYGVAPDKIRTMPACAMGAWKKNKDMPPLPVEPDISLPSSQCQMPPCYAPQENK